MPFLPMFEAVKPAFHLLQTEHQARCLLATATTCSPALLSVPLPPVALASSRRPSAARLLRPPLSLPLPRRPLPSAPRPARALPTPARCLPTLRTTTAVSSLPTGEQSSPQSLFRKTIADWIGDGRHFHANASESSAGLNEPMGEPKVLDRNLLRMRNAKDLAGLH